jgi:phage terminase large subunit GpA-like protein
MIAVRQIRLNALNTLIPPLRLALSTWIEQNIRSPQGVSALPGPVRLWPYQVGIADAISDPAIERVTVVKPTESDARDYMASDLEMAFATTSAPRRL